MERQEHVEEALEEPHHMRYAGFTGEAAVVDGEHSRRRPETVHGGVGDFGHQFARWERGKRRGLTLSVME